MGKSKASIDIRLLGLPGPYHRHAIGTFNTCSRGSTHRSLTDTGGGNNLGRASLPHTTPQPFEPDVSTFHLWPLPVSSLAKFHQLKQSAEFKEPMTTTWSFNHSAIYHSLDLHPAIANDLSPVIGVARIDQKVVIMQLGYQINSYNLMHIQES
jgi:hypothetical protein